MRIETPSLPPPAAPVPVRRRRLMRVLFGVKLVISFGLLAVLFYWIDIGTLLDKFANLRWGWLAAGLGILQTQNLLSTLKWRMILRVDGHHVPFFFLWRTYLISGFLSLFLPSSFGGDVYRVWALNQRNIKVSKSTASVLFDRLTGVFALLTIGIAGSLFLVGGSYAITVLVAYVLGIGGFWAITSEVVLARLSRTTPKILGFLVRILTSFGAYRRSPRRLVPMLALSLMFQFNIVLIIVCYARALRIPSSDISFLEFVAMVPVVYLTEMLPITINGIGVRDGAFVFFFKKLGSTAEHALGLSLLVVAIRYINGLVGGTLLLQSMLQQRRAPEAGALPTDADALKRVIPGTSD